MKELEDGGRAVGFCNFVRRAVKLDYKNLKKLGITCRHLVRGLWRQKDLGVIDPSIRALPLEIPAHGVVLQARVEEGEKVHLVFDNAGWHRILPVDLSPDSPDFNPIERLWEHLNGQAMQASGRTMENRPPTNSSRRSNSCWINPTSSIPSVRRPASIGIDFRQPD